ncbi:MAG TPA: DUF1501 domain-containing protein [Gemmataceae bacterium]|jgi:uncharacterized protein (DUF1501 family)|nr:DUF1501 domain-containing protein [Gemmataceae bacterium]
MLERYRTDCEGFHRRDFLKIGAAGLFGLSLPQLLRLEAQAAAEARSKRRANSVIMVWLAGGPATIDMWDLKPAAPEGIRGEFKPIASRAPGIQICEHLPKTAQVIDKATLVRSLYHTIPSHGPATVFMTTGNQPTPALQYPSLGSLVARLLPAEPAVPPYVSFSDIRGGSAGQAGYLGTAYNPFGVEGGGKGGNLRVRGISLPTKFTLQQLDNRNRLLEDFDKTFQSIDRSADLADGLDAFHKQALEILRSDKTRKAFDLSQESPGLRDRYGKTPFGQGALAARRLVEAGVRFVTISLGGWDTHGRNFETLSKRLLPQLDQTLSALLEDLANQGMLDRTVVYCAGEFGRTPKVNKNAGRDHWARSMAVLLAGGGFKQGYAHGTTDIQGMAPAADGCTPDDISATLFHCLGIDPHQELRTPTGRPVQLFREGKIVEKLLS